MPIDIEYLRAHEEAAIHFVQSQDGLILNVVARAVAASKHKIHGGHLIIHQNMNNPTGAFVLSPKYRNAFEGSEAQTFSRISGLIAERFFCNAPSVARSLADLAAVVRIDHHFNPHDRNQDIAIQHVLQKYGDEFAQVFDYVHSSYCIARRAVTSGKFLINEYHVIPSHLLKSFYSPLNPHKLMHYFATHSFKKRSEALNYVLANRELMLPSILQNEPDE